MKLLLSFLSFLSVVVAQDPQLGLCSIFEALRPVPFHNLNCTALYEECISTGSINVYNYPFIECNSTLQTVDSLRYPTYLEGSIPSEIENLVDLQTLYIGNGINGTIPTQIGKLRNLENLRIMGGNLVGMIPPEIGNLASLSNLYITMDTTIPTQIGKLNQLFSLVIDGGVLNLPKEIGNLKSLYTLKITAHSMTGTIPSELGLLSELAVLAIEDTKLTGTIPNQLTKLSKLISLQMSVNTNLTGTIPWEFGCNCPDLSLIIFDGNRQLSGTIPPEFGFLTKLNILSISGSSIGGTIPMELSVVPNRFNRLYQWCRVTPPTIDGHYNSSIEHLYLRGNKLVGTIPSELAAMPNLLRLDLSDNNLQGTIPPEIFNHTVLLGLRLNKNALTGTIPPLLGRPFNKTKFSFNAAYNSLIGTIPPELVNASIGLLDVSYNRLTGTLPPDAFFLTSFKTLGNELSGTIPLEYCSVQWTSVFFGGNLHGCYFNCTNLRRHSTKFSCGLNGSTFGCQSQCAAPPDCGSSCSDEYNNYPSVKSNQSTPSQPPTPSIPSTHSPSSLVSFINTNFNITAPLWVSLYSFSSYLIFKGDEINSSNIILHSSNAILLATALNSPDFIGTNSLISVKGASVISTNSLSMLGSSWALSTNSSLTFLIHGGGSFELSGNISVDTSSKVIVDGACANFSNTDLILNVDKSDRQADQTTVVESRSDCTVSFRSVIVQGNCKVVQAKQLVQSSSILINWEVTSNRCRSDITIPVVVSVVGFIALSVIAIVLLAIFHPTFRKMVLPYKDRSKYVYKKKNIYGSNSDHYVEGVERKDSLQGINSE